MNEWRNQAYQHYLSTHYLHLNRLDVVGYELAAQAYQRIWDTVLPLDRTVRCLDVGCGAGKFLYYLRQRGFEQIEGVDLPPENAELARQMGFAVTVGDAVHYLETSHAAGKRYGLVAALDVIEHLTRQELFDMLNLVAALLEPNGRMLIKTVNAASLIGIYGRYMDITHELAFSEETLRQVFTCTGFSQIDVLQTVGHGLKGQVRRWLKEGLYWVVYRLIEGRPSPTAIDFDIVAVAYR